MGTLNIPKGDVLSAIRVFDQKELTLNSNTCLVQSGNIYGFSGFRGNLRWRNSDQVSNALRFFVFSGHLETAIHDYSEYFLDISG